MHAILRLWIWSSLILCSFFVSDVSGEPKRPHFDNAVILFADKRISVEVASTKEQHKYGLMFRHHLPWDRGMLFVFKDERKRCFWMKNTSIPLDIAYFDANKKLFQITPMKPFSTKCVESKKKAKFALEMNQGWFRKNQIKSCTMFQFKN